ncbi:MAG: cytochrome c biogenesis protein ResB [Anaerolineae bacterium]
MARNTVKAHWTAWWSSEDPLDSLWRVFASPYLTMLLLASLAMLICLGIILPQRPVEAITDLMANNLWLTSLRERYHNAADWLVRLKLSDIHRSLWLRGILGLLAFNLLLGTVDLIRPRHGWHTGLERKVLVNDPVLVSSPEQVLECVRQILHDQHYRYLAGKNNRLACADRSWTGPLLVYLGLLLILGGLAISERTAWWEDNVTLRPGQVRPLGHGINLAVRADTITAKIDPSGRKANNGHTELAFLQENGETTRKTLQNLTPLFYGSLLFYQTSTEPVLLVQAQDANGRNLPLRTPETGATQFMEVALHFREGDTPRYFVVLDVMPGSQLSRQFQQSGLERYVLVPSRDLSLRLRYNPIHPGATTPFFTVEAFRSAETLSFYQHQFHTAETVEIAGDRYSFQPQRYAVIKFGRDYGLVFILPGAVLVLLGIILSVRQPLKRIWLAIQPFRGAVNLHLVVNAPATEGEPPWFESLVQDIVAALNVEKEAGRNHPALGGKT